jgi:hypothetical protein
MIKDQLGYDVVPLITRVEASAALVDHDPDAPRNRAEAGVKAWTLGLDRL